MTRTRPLVAVQTAISIAIIAAAADARLALAAVIATGAVGLTSTRWSSAAAAILAATIATLAIIAGQTPAGVARYIGARARPPAKESQGSLSGPRPAPQRRGRGSSLR